MQHLQHARVVVVEDDPTSAEFTSHILTEMGGCEVVHFADPREALDFLAVEQCDAVVTDVVLPGFSGLSVLKQLGTLRPDVPVIVVTAYATVDIAVDAVRANAAGFLRKPYRPSELIERLGSQIAATRRRRPRQRVLAVGAHPDDIELGVGATLHRHFLAGDEITFAIMSHGVQGSDGDTRINEAEAAARQLDAQVHFGDLTDTEIPEEHPAVTFLEGVTEMVDPTVVYTHSVHDVDQDHRNTHRATLVACRRVPAVYCYQSPSATVHFNPSFFVSVDDEVEAKLRLVATHASQAAKRSYMEPELISASARYWGRFAATDYAEAFEVVRERGAIFAGVDNVAA